MLCPQGNFDEAEDPDDYEGESDGDSDASDDAAAGRGNLITRLPYDLLLLKPRIKYSSVRSLSTLVTLFS